MSVVAVFLSEINQFTLISKISESATFGIVLIKACLCEPALLTLLERVGRKEESRGIEQGVQPCIGVHVIPSLLYREAPVVPGPAIGSRGLLEEKDRLVARYFGQRNQSSTDPARCIAGNLHHLSHQVAQRSSSHGNSKNSPRLLHCKAERTVAEEAHRMMKHSAGIVRQPRRDA